MEPDLLRDNCSRCAALCCVALAFDKSRLFAFDKPAGAPCRHLGADARCRIHARRAKAGFAGCVRFTCHGAGQRVVQQCFDGRTWQSEPALFAPMLRAFHDARIVHELLMLLTEAQKLPLCAAQRLRSEELVSNLTPQDGVMSTAWLATFRASGIEITVRRFLSELGPLVERRASPPTAQAKIS